MAQIDLGCEQLYFARYTRFDGLFDSEVQSKPSTVTIEEIVEKPQVNGAAFEQPAIEEAPKKGESSRVWTAVKLTAGAAAAVAVLQYGLPALAQRADAFSFEEGPCADNAFGQAKEVAQDAFAAMKENPIFQQFAEGKGAFTQINAAYNVTGGASDFYRGFTGETASKTLENLSQKYEDTKQAVADAGESFIESTRSAYAFGQFLGNAMKFTYDYGLYALGVTGALYTVGTVAPIAGTVAGGASATLTGAKTMATSAAAGAKAIAKGGPGFAQKISTAAFYGLATVAAMAKYLPGVKRPYGR